MVAHLVKLRLTLLKHTFSRNTAQVIGIVFGLIGAVVVGGLLVTGLIGARSLSARAHQAVPVAMLATMTIAWIMLSLIAAGVDDALEPGRFALFPVRAKDLMPGLLVAGLVGAEGIFLLALFVGFIVSWAGSIATLVTAVVAGVLGFLTMMLSTRFLTSAMNSLMHTRKFRDLASILLMAVFMSYGIGMQVLGAGAGKSQPGQLESMMVNSAGVLGWTPFGWAWSVPSDLDAGRYAFAGLRFLLALAVVVGLWLGWAKYLDKALTSPLEAHEESGKVKANSWVDRLYPATPAGAIAARSLRYWRRDPRHVMSMVTLLVMPFLFAVPILLNSSSTPETRSYILPWVPAFFGFMIGPVLSQELSYDGSALWTHIVAGVRGIDDRRGRLGAMLTIVLPLFAVIIVGLGFVMPLGKLPASMAVGLAIMLNGCGAAAWISTIWNVPSPPPGSNPFQKGSGGGVATWLNFLFIMLITFIPAGPTLVLATIGLYAEGKGAFCWYALAASLVIGGILLWGGMRLGGKRLDGHWPEILKQVTFEKS